MVVLEGGAVSYELGASVVGDSRWRQRLAAVEKGYNNSKGLKDFYLKAKASIWP